MVSKVISFVLDSRIRGGENGFMNFEALVSDDDENITGLRKRMG